MHHHRINLSLSSVIDQLGLYWSYLEMHCAVCHSEIFKNYVKISEYYEIFCKSLDYLKHDKVSRRLFRDARYSCETNGLLAYT